MAEMTPRKRALLCVTGNKRRADRLALCNTQTTVTVDQMNIVRAPFPEANRDPELMYRLAAAAWEVTGQEGFKLPFDVCIEAEILGAEINWGRIDRNPSVASHPFKELKDLRIPEKITELGRFPMKHNVEYRLRREYGDYLPIVNQVIGPFTLGGHLFGIEKFCIWTKKRPQEEVKEALMQIAEINIEDSKQAIISGTDIIAIGDPSATSDILSPQFFKDVMIPVYRHMARKIGCPIVLHICGNTTAYLPYIAETEFDMLSVDAQVDISFAKQIVGDKIAIGGGIPTINVLLLGTPQKVKEAAIDAVKKGVDMLMPSCGIPPRSPLENVRAMSEVAKCLIYA